MGFLGFESRREKDLRLKILDMENELRKLHAEKNNIPFFGTRYMDDDRRYKSERTIDFKFNIG